MAKWRFEGAAEFNRDAAAGFPDRSRRWPTWQAQPVPVPELEQAVSQRQVPVQREQPRPVAVPMD